MFPYHDENETQRPAYVTLVIIGLCVFAWVFIQGAGAEEPLARSVCNLGLIPGELSNALPAGVGTPMSDRLVCVTDPGRQYRKHLHVDVHARLVDAPHRQHVVPVALREQRRRLDDPAAVPDFLPHLRRRRGAGAGGGRPRICHPDGRRLGCDQRRHGCLPRALSARPRLHAGDARLLLDHHRRCRRGGC